MLNSRLVAFDVLWTTRQKKGVLLRLNHGPDIAMAEWLTLLVLVPAIVVPVVLLVGFAGCDKVWGLIHVPDRPSVPMIESADGISGSVITLKWKFYDEALEFVFERLKVKDGTTT